MAATEPSLAWQYVVKWAELRPREEALVFGDRRVTWREFYEQVDALAQALLDAGVSRGDRVALLAMGCPEFAITFMAAAKVGAIWLGLSPKFTRRELEFILQDARPSVLVALREYGGRDLAEDLRALKACVPGIRELVVLGEPFEGVKSYGSFVASPKPVLTERASQGRPDDPVLLMYTSGSTGTPKGVVHTHRSILASVQTQNTHFGLHAGSRALLHFPINHVAADVEIGMATIHAGATLVLMDRFDPTLSLRAVERERITLLGQVPAMFLMQLAGSDLMHADLGSVETFVWAGSPAPRGLVGALASIAARNDARLITGYGSTESGGFVTFTDPGDSLDMLADTVGRVAAPSELRIVDDERRDLSDGQSGEIALRGPTLMQGYWNNPDATAEVLDASGWYYTGDIAFRNPDGAVRIVGRKSDMYKSGGESIHPREIEQVLDSHPAVAASAVVGVPDELFQEAGWAFVTLKPGAEATAEDLLAHCRASLANFKVPKRVIFRPRLPLLPNGKIDKMALRNEAEGERPY